MVGEWQNVLVEESGAKHVFFATVSKEGCQSIVFCTGVAVRLRKSSLDFAYLFKIFIQETK